MYICINATRSSFGCLVRKILRWSQSCVALFFLLPLYISLIASAIWLELHFMVSLFIGLRYETTAILGGEIAATVSFKFQFNNSKVQLFRLRWRYKRFVPHAPQIALKHQSTHWLASENQPERHYRQIARAWRDHSLATNFRGRHVW